MVAVALAAAVSRPTVVESLRSAWAWKMRCSAWLTLLICASRASRENDDDMSPMMANLTMI